MIKQEQLDAVLHFIEQFCDDNGYAPSIREICKGMGFRSTATAYNYIARLRDSGALQKSDMKKRAVSVQTNVKKVPLIGTVTAGMPIFAVENYEGYYGLPSDEYKDENLFMLTVSGDSMINAGIFDGDKIIVRQQPIAENGEIVVALIDDGATVKRFFKRKDTIVLRPENPRYRDIVSDNVAILGKVIGLIRKI
ncbi:MAG: transcriptional repressor LexA [Clostridia bacterium]|nr:transcriptional repressor LexA [Clostridia bacterium]